MSKKFGSLLVVIILIITMTACGGSSTSSSGGTAGGATGGTSAGSTEDFPEVTLKVANYLASGNVCEKYIFNPLAEALAEANITFEYYPGATLLEGNQILDGVIDGTADIGYIAVAYFPGRFPVSAMVEYPIEYASATAASYAFKELLDELQPPELNDFHTMMAFASGPGCFLSTKPVRTLEDMKGLQIRSNALQGEAMKALGAVPATLTMGETYDALRSGIVDAFVGLLEAGHSNKLYEVAPYFTHYPYANIGQMVIINNDSYASLTDAQRAIFDEAVERIYFESVVSFMGWSGIPAVEDYQADGYEEITMTDAEIAKFGAALSTLLDDYAATIDNGQEVKELLLKLAAENNAKYPTDPAEK